MNLNEKIEKDVERIKVLRNTIMGQRKVTRKRFGEMESKLKEAKRLVTGVVYARALTNAQKAGTAPDLIEWIERMETVKQLLDYDNYPKYDFAGLLKVGITQTNFVEAKAQMKALPIEIPPILQLDDVELRIRELDLGLSGIPGYFPTPDNVVDTLLNTAMEFYTDALDDARILEPSAGSGAIADGVQRKWNRKIDTLVEWNWTLHKLLVDKGYNAFHADFTEWEDGTQYDLILMNPPFEQGKDIDHVMRAYDLLADGGILVSIVGAGSMMPSKKGKKYQEWFEWKNDRQVHEEDLGAAFTEGVVATSTRSYLVVLAK